MPNHIYENLSTTIFEVMSELARSRGAINLGQGFPDTPGPITVRKKAAEFAVHGPHQYPPVAGLPELREAAENFYRRFQQLDLDWRDEITITTGASEAIASAIFALINTGDEVVLFEPAYDSYLPLVQRAGGTARFVRLRPPTWEFTREDLDASFSSNTKLVIFNNPMNPTGVVFCEDALSLLSEYCVRFDVTVICDEVWEHIVFEGRQHRPLMSFPGMRDRTIKVSSAGKLFSLTGWKVGFMIASPELTTILCKAHQFFSFTVPPNLQRAIAWGLANCDEWFVELPAGLERSRNRLRQRLQNCGFHVLKGQGTYFLNIDLGLSGIPEDDLTFCLRAVEHHGVATIPISAFCQGRYIDNVIRLCFAKTDDVLDQAAEQLANARDVVRTQPANKFDVPPRLMPI